MAFSLGLTIVKDDKGNAGLLVHSGLGGAFGAVVGGGGGYQETDANTIFDLAGLSFTAGVGLGAGAFVGAEFNSALDLSYSGKTTSVGIGTGAGVFLIIEESILFETDFEKTSNVIEHVQKGGELIIVNGKILLIDSEGNKTDSGITITTGLEKGTVGRNMYDRIRRIFSGTDKEDEDQNNQEQ